MTAPRPPGDPAGAARAFARRLAAFEEGPIRAGAAARALAALEPAEAVALLAALARQVGGEGRAALTAVGQALVGPDAALLYEHLAEVYATAAEEQLLEVTSLLMAPPPRREWVAPRDKADPRLAHLTLGHKKTMARTHRDPDLLARLAAEGEPPVVRELLRNQQLTEDFALRLAARRPIRPEVLALLAGSERWRTRPAVMLAVVRNPYAAPGLTLKLLPFLAAADLGDVAVDRTLHPLVQAAAGRLARQRAGG